MATAGYDYAIVGGGSAGCVLVYWIPNTHDYQ